MSFAGSLSVRVEVTQSMPQMTCEAVPDPLPASTLAA